MALTVKDELFARASIAGKSNREAAIEAGCPEGTASAAGSRFARKPEIIELIALLKQAEQEAACELATEAVSVTNANTNGLKLLKPMVDKECTEGGGESAEHRLIPMAPPQPSEADNDVANVATIVDSAKPKADANMGMDSLEFLRQVMHDKNAPQKLRLEAAKELAKYEHARVAPQGKREAEQDAAAAVAGSRLRPMPPPNPQGYMFNDTEAPIPPQRPKGYMQ